MKWLHAVLWVAYPLVIFFGLQVLEPRYVALALGAVLLLRQRDNAGRFLGSMSRVDWGVMLSLLGLASLTIITNSEIMLRMYPAGMSLGMLILFGLSLKFPPSMVERFARLSEPNLPAAGVRYTRVVTQVWCVFFVFNASVASYTALYCSRDTWGLYNGLIAYVLMGALFAGVWLVRLHQRARDSL